MWQCFLDIIDVLSKITQTGIAAFGAWLAWKTFLKSDEQEAESELDITAQAIAISEIKIFETKNQTTILRKTKAGLECHLAERRPGKVGGHKWTLSSDAVKQVLETGDIYVNPGWKIRTGLISIGTHRNWLYSKKLFPEPAELHHQLVGLMKSIIT